MPKTQTSAAPRHTNRLARESSPYLLQHAHNPVDWYPWGPEAFELARAQDKPIFLSVGYSTCYWCHVMERGCFENEAIAAEMNRRFVNIKVDREQRPDVDQLYMTAVQVLTRHGGWPMSVWLMPDLRPFYGGTYFPPEDAHGRPGFPTMLRALEDAYRNRRGDVEQTAGELAGILRQLAEPPTANHRIVFDQAFLEELIERSVADYDAQQGGFGSAPKFPRETLLELLLTWCGQESAGSAKPTSGDNQSQIKNRKSKISEMLRRTLDAMANGGIRDHLGGGFHRYSTDARWLVPHFEIMLYDNAMLAWCYTEAHRQTGEQRYARVARGIFDFVLREMTSPAGAFYTAFDAEVDAQEGGSYLWTAEEIQRLLGRENAEVFNGVYGVDRGPNFADPHHGTGMLDRNILFLPDGPAREDDPKIATMRRRLLMARANRKQPLLDTKILTSWNALMIRALAHGARILKEPRYLEAAQRAAEFLLEHHRAPDGGLYRTGPGEGAVAAEMRDGGSVSAFPGFLDDYAFLIQAMLDLSEGGAPGSVEAKWKDHAAELSAVMVRKFGDASGTRGFYFTEASASDLIVRQKTASDSPLPSGNAVAAMSLLRLGQVESAVGVLRTFAQQLEHNAEGMSSMLQAAVMCVGEQGEFTVEPAAGDKGAAGADRPLSPQELASEVVSARAEWIDDTRLAVHVQVLPGFHINASDAEASADANGAGLVGTEVLVGRDDADQVGEIEYPPGQVQRFEYAQELVRAYVGHVVVHVTFQSSMAGRPVPRLALKYQACDERACLAPVTKPIDVPPAPGA